MTTILLMAGVIMLLLTVYTKQHNVGSTDDIIQYDYREHDDIASRLLNMGSHTQSQDIVNIQKSKTVAKNRKRLFDEIVSDVKLFQDYHNSYDTIIFKVWVAAYILDSKVSRTRSYPYITMLRQFKFVNRTRTCDQTKVVLYLIDNDTRELLTLMIDRTLSKYENLSPDVYETLMVNCVFDIIEHTLEKIDNDNKTFLQRDSQSDRSHR